MGTAAGRWVLLTTVLGSGIVMIDTTVVNVALPHIGRDLGAGFGGLQWTINAYTLTLASLILLGGSLGDHFGRRRMFLIGVIWFALASAACGLAPNIGMLVAARALQGVGGALLTPGSLALISASFHGPDRAAAIGAWSGLGGLAGAVGPFLGGFLVEWSWRAVFLINLPLAVLVVAVTVLRVPESRDLQSAPGLDATGTVLAVLGLGGLTYGLTGLGNRGATADALIAIGVGVLALVREAASASTPKRRRSLSCVRGGAAIPNPGQPVGQTSRGRVRQVPCRSRGPGAVCRSPALGDPQHCHRHHEYRRARVDEKDCAPTPFDKEKPPRNGDRAATEGLHAPIAARGPPSGTTPRSTPSCPG